MEDEEDNETAVPRRLLKTGDVRFIGHATVGYKSPEMTNSLQSLTQSESWPQINRTSESLLPADQHLHGSILYPARAASYGIPLSPTHVMYADDRRAKRTEHEFPFSKMFPKAPGPNMTVHDVQGVRDALPNDSYSAESQMNNPFFRSIHSSRSHSAHPCNSINQTEKSLFEEKFLLRESILSGCDLVAALEAHKMPTFAEIKLYSDCIREKTLQSRPQNVCTRLSQDESLIFAEYLKSFLLVADSWLEVRNCFGSTDQCYNEICTLHSRDLTNAYTEWMHASRLLLNNIVTGLRRVFGKQDTSLSSRGERALTDISSKAKHIGTTENMAEHGLSFPINWPYENKNDVWNNCNTSSCGCQPRPRNSADVCSTSYRRSCSDGRYRYSDSQLWVNGPCPSMSALPNNTRSCPNVDDCYSMGEYLQPGSYDVPRSNLTYQQKCSNISVAKMNCCQGQEGISNAYVINLSNKKLVSQGVPVKNKSCSLSDGGNPEDDILMIDFNEINRTNSKSDDWIVSLMKSQECKDIMKNQILADRLSLTKEMKNQNIDDECGSCNQDTDSPESIDEHQDFEISAKETHREIKIIKNSKTSWQSCKRRRVLTQRHALQIQAIVHELWKCDIPDYVKYPVKNNQADFNKIVKRPIFLETIANKSKNGVYETIEQFIHDCRRLNVNASIYSERNSAEKEMVEKFSSKFETLLEHNCDQIQQWKHISGDPKEVNFYPELRYLNTTRKRPRTPKVFLGADTAANTI